jgi:tetratricopeptide (TPR) repeat protein
MQPLPARRIFLLFIPALAFVVSISAQQQAPAGQPPSPTAPQNANRIVIQDPAEYKAYMAAYNTQDATARAAAMEAFAAQYPKSIVASDALENAMAAWQLVGNSGKVEEASRRLLAVEPGNVRALAIVVAIDRAKATEGDGNALSELCPYASAGLREVGTWQRPGGMTDADFAALSRQMSLIFNGASGFCALQSKDYSQARDWLTRAFTLDPTSLQDVYQLAVADLEMTPLDAGGFWYCAKAIHLAQGSGNSKAADGFSTYCKTGYARYHGSEDGWDALVAASATQSALPAGFAGQITPAQ